MTFILLFAGLVLTMLTGLALADAAIRESKRRITDDVPAIDKELQLNAKIRELQGISRVGDELTERYKTVEHVGRVRESATLVVYDEAASFDMDELLAIKPKLKSGKIIRATAQEVKDER
jgi:hypothetical protein